MIIDKLQNISKYIEIPDYAVKFITENKNIDFGKYFLNDTEFANVEKYNTKKLNDAKFESHNEFIDIQILLSGCEKIYVTDVEKLNVDIPYNKDKDITFYNDNIRPFDSVTLDGTNFVMLFPHEAHAPQVSINDESKPVKKMVVKLKVK